MNGSRFIRFALLSVLALFCAATADAAPRKSHGPKRQLQTLIITGNYKSPRLLAELIQNESRQPYILLPDPSRGDNRIYFCPPKSNALEIREADFNNFIRTAAPKRIVILGDERYVPRRFEDLLDKAIPVVRITGANWFRVAEELKFMLNLNHLDKNYRRLRQTMLEEGGIYRPISRPAAPRQEVAPEAPVEEFTETAVVETPPTSAETEAR